MPNFAHVITTAYREILLRDPDPFGATDYNRRMNEGLSLADLRRELLLSAEYAARFPGGGTPPPPGPFPIRAAFYYPWFPEAWDQGGQVPWTRFTPPSLYNSGDMAVVMRHLKALEYGGFQAGILSWWGQGSPTDSRVDVILDTTAAEHSPLKWGFYYETESLGNPTVESLRADFNYLLARYAAHPCALKVDGKLVVFVYADATDGCEMAQRWESAVAGLPIYVSIKVVVGWPNCEGLPDSWHDYVPDRADQRVAGHSYVISPGFWIANEAAPRLSRDLTRWRQSIRSMIASGEKWQLVTSFNEWGEGSIVEQAAEWPSASGFGTYLDALHFNGAS